MDCEDFELSTDPLPSFKLRGRQQDWCDSVEADERANFSRLLFLAPGGIGKGSILGHLAKKKWEEQGIRTLVTENREHLVGQMADRIRDEIGLECDVEMAGSTASPNAPCVVASVQSLGRVNRLTSFSDDHFGFVVPDECFPSSVKVDGKSIAEIRPGDRINSYNHEKQIIEIRRVLATSKSLSNSLVQVHIGARKIICTEGHPFFTKRGYVRAIDLRCGDQAAANTDELPRLRDGDIEVKSRKKAEAEMRSVQKEARDGECRNANCPMQAVPEAAQVLWIKAQLHEPVQCKERQSLLQYRVQGRMGEQFPENEHDGARQSPSNEGRVFRANEEEKPHGRSEERHEDGGGHEREDVSFPRREWSTHCSAESPFNRAGGCRDGVSNRDLSGPQSIPISSAMLQSRYSHTGSQAGYRSRRRKPQVEEMEILGSPKNGGLEFVRVDRVEILEPRSASKFDAMRGDRYVYNLEVEGNNNYFADGFLVHNCHLSLAPQPSRILSYFHWGAESLAEDWKRPKDGEYKPKSTICGFTASPNIGSGRHLSELYHRVSVNYSYLEAIEEGWLVGIEERNIPVSIDTRKFRTKRTAEGAAFNTTDQSAAIIPVIGELAKQIVREAFDRKTICFLPSVECARLMAETLKGMGLRAIFVSGECLDKSDKIIEYNAAPPGTVLCNCALVVYGIDFVDTDCIAPFSAVISKANYVQKIYRGTRVLKGVLKDGMDARQRRAAIAASAKPKLLVLSPFFISDRIDLCEIFDLFTDIPREKGKKPKTGGDFATPEKVRDWLASIEKAADPHRNKQARSIDPVAFSLSVGQERIAAIAVDGDAPATRPELDALLQFGIDTTQVTSSAQAQRLISTLRERDRLHLASPKAIHQLTLRLGWPEELASKMKGKQAGVLIARGVRYSAPRQAETVPADDPALAYGKG